MPKYSRKAWEEAGTQAASMTRMAMFRIHVTTLEPSHRLALGKAQVFVSCDRVPPNLPGAVLLEPKVFCSGHSSFGLECRYLGKVKRHAGLRSVLGQDIGPASRESIDALHWFV